LTVVGKFLIYLTGLSNPIGRIQVLMRWAHGLPGFDTGKILRLAGLVAKHRHAQKPDAGWLDARQVYRLAGVGI
tara:strand:- start:35 stop:256 length:222 start_codon:yes stop_codon:yes gene_type:complete